MGKQKNDGRLFSTRKELAADVGRVNDLKSSRVNFSKAGFPPFGHCMMSLKPLEDPVATPSGHVYSREVILSYLLQCKRELRTQRRAFKEQQKSIEYQRREEARSGKELEKARFLEANSRVDRVDDVPSSVLGFEKSSKDSTEAAEDVSKLGNRDIETYQDGLKRRNLNIGTMQGDLKRSKRDLETKEEKLEQLRLSSPWLASFAPSANPKLLENPSKRPLSPFSKQPLAMNQLTGFSVFRDADNFALCQVSKKIIKYQPVVLIKPSGIVVLESVFDEIVRPAMKCPITSKKLTSEDILHLKSIG